MSFVPPIGAGGINLAGPTPIVIIQVGSGLTVAVFEDLNNWADSIVAVAGGSVSLAVAIADSNASNWADAASFQHGTSIGIADTMTQTDSVDLVYTKRMTLSDSMTLTDSAVIAQNIQKTLSDTLTQSDAVTVVLGLNQTPSDTMTPSDAITLRVEYRMTFVDLDNTWNDSIAETYAYLMALSDTETLTDAVSAVRNNFTGDIQLAFGETLNNWAESVTLFSAWLLAFSDNLNVWSDALTKQLTSTGLSLSDTMSMSDAITIATVLKLQLTDHLH